jgi:CRISPR/Cas system CSM-associated protein Csm3 (group 7 of RAMP superfamily)
MDEQPKFYSTIPVVHKETDDVGAERGHQSLKQNRLTGRLSFDLVALQRLHVGSGQLLPPDVLGLESDLPLVKEFVRTGDILTLPGSSLKGSFRSLVELFTASCVSKTTVRWPAYERDQFGECRYNSRRRLVDLCPACKLFGAMGYQGQVRFDDALQTAGSHEIYLIPPQYKPVPDKNYRRYYPYDLSDDRERTWPLEAATAGSRFAVRAQFTNLAQEELGLLLIALGQGRWRLCPRIGAGKSSGLGGTRVENLVAESWQVKQAFRSFDSNVWQPVNLDASVNSAQSLVRSDVLDDLARDLDQSLISEAP